MKQGTKVNKPTKGKTNKPKKGKTNKPIPSNINPVNRKPANINPSNINPVNINPVNRKPKNATSKSPQNGLTPNNFEDAYRIMGLGITRIKFKEQYY